MNKFLKGAVVLLIAVAMVFSTTAVTADTEKETNEVEMDMSYLKSTNPKPTNPIIAPAIGPVGFSQPPPEQGDPAEFYLSDRSLVTICMDDFWGLTADIYDIHWWGLSLKYVGYWIECDPEGMEFEIKFYDMDMNLVCTYADLMPTAQPTGKFFLGFEMYKWEFDLDPCCSLTDGWVSIYRTPNPINSCSFLWANSSTGNMNAEQDGNPLDDNLAFELTYKKSRVFSTSLLNWLQNHPNLFPLLQKLLSQLGFGL